MSPLPACDLLERRADGSIGRPPRELRVDARGDTTRESHLHDDLTRQHRQRRRAKAGKRASRRAVSAGRRDLSVDGARHGEAELRATDLVERVLVSGRDELRGSAKRHQIERTAGRRPRERDAPTARSPAMPSRARRAWRRRSRRRRAAATASRPGARPLPSRRTTAGAGDHRAPTEHGRAAAPPRPGARLRSRAARTASRRSRPFACQENARPQLLFHGSVDHGSGSVTSSNLP